jgi:PAS domain S-box-containing protein
MPAPKIASNLLETLLAVPDSDFWLDLPIHESIELSTTVDGFTVPIVHRGQKVMPEKGGKHIPELAFEPDESDLAELPRRNVVDPGGSLGLDADYRLVGSIGRGGTGIVFQAHQRAINREVAIKVLRGHLRKDPAARQRFLTEARTIGALDHPNVIALHELAADTTGRLFYSMKRIDGTAWSAVLAERSLEDNLTILLGVADAIRYAHSRGIVHRDIKPANVMLGRYGEVLVADWGLALPHPIPIHEAENSKNSIGGTPAYMAPELAIGALEEVGPQTDVYLLGATLFEILTGFPPHDGSNLIDCIQNAADNRIRASMIQSDLMDVALMAMATEPMERYHTVESFQNAIREYQQHQESTALVLRAAMHEKQAAEGQTYERFSLAISLTREALDLWPENRRAKSTLRRLRIEFAKVAAAQDDLDFALSLLEAAGEQESELAAGIRYRREQRLASAQREERYSTLFANSPDAVLVTRMLDGTVLEANDTFLRIFEHEREDVVGARVAEFRLWECPERREDFVRQIRETGRIDNFETTLQTRTNRKIPVLISARKTEFDGEPLVVAHTRDITQRRAVEEELRRSRTRLREIQQLASLGTWEVDLRTNQVSWSNETFKIAGFAPDSRPPNIEQYLESVHPDDREKTKNAIESAIQSGAAYQLEIRHRRPDGTYNTVIARGQPIIDATNTVVELYGTVLDITDRKASENEMAKQVHRLQTLLDFCERPLFALDREGAMVSSSSHFRKLFGRESLDSKSEWQFESVEPIDFRNLNDEVELDGRFTLHGVPTGQTIRVKVRPADDLLCCEVLV